MSEADHHGAGRVLIGRVQEHRQRHDFQLRDQGAQVDAVPVHLHAARCFPAQLIQQLGIEHVAIQPQIEVHDVVQHAAGPIDFVHHPVLVANLGHTRERPPLVGAGGLVADDLEMVGALIESEPQGDGSRDAGGALQSMAAAHLLGDFVQYGHLADVIESNGRIVMPEGTTRHQAEQENAGLVVEPGGDMKIRERRAEQIVDVRNPMQHGVGVDALRAVQKRDHEGYGAVVRQQPSADHKCAAIAEKTRLDDVESQRRNGVRLMP